MPGLRAKVRNINDGCRVVCFHCQALSGCERLQAFSRFEHGKGAQQTCRVEFGCIGCHSGEISVMFQTVHKVVTQPWGDATYWII